VAAPEPEPAAAPAPGLPPVAEGEPDWDLPPEPADGTGAELPPEPDFLEEEPVLEQFGNYDLLEKVAVGGMAELFKARVSGDRTGGWVAIKRILPHLSANDEFVRMFIDEAKLAAQLSHPNIVQIHDLGKARGAYYIAMEFVDGRDLRSLLRRMRETRRPMPEVLAAGVTLKIAQALDYAHRKRGVDDQELRLVHRDVSPQNILVSFDGAVKLADFGIAKAATQGTQTQGGALKGKLLYMSPEQALGLPLDGRSDLYSLGLLLAELLTGERAFQADSELGVLEKVRQGKVLDPRSVNPALSPEMGAILNRLLAKGVNQRYASARNLERDLEAFLGKRGGEPSPEDLAEYVQVLLKGTREELEGLLDRVYPLPEPVPAAGPGSPPPDPARGARDLDDPPTLPGTGATTAGGGAGTGSFATQDLAAGAMGTAGTGRPAVPAEGSGPRRAPAAARPSHGRPKHRPGRNHEDEPALSKAQVAMLLTLIIGLLIWLAAMVFG
jgi:hypothetical protein